MVKDLRVKDLGFYASNAGLSGATLLTGIGAEVLLHQPLVVFAGGVLAYLSWKYDGGTKALEIKKVVESGGGLEGVGEKLIGLKKQLGKEGVATTGETDKVKVDFSHGKPTTLADAESDTTGVDPVFPRYEDDETLCIGRVIATGQRFDPNINALLGSGLIASAVQGAGKSVLMGRILEQAGKCGVPEIILDHKGEYGTMTNLPYINGLRAGSEALVRELGPSCFELTPDNAYEFVNYVVTNEFQAIIDLPSYGKDWIDKAEMAYAVGKAMMDWGYDQPVKKRKPCLAVLDEAQLYIPQNVNLLPPDARKNPDLVGGLSNAFFSLVSNGRSYGFTMCFATQSLTYIAKWAIKSCQCRIFLRHSEKNDLDMCGEIINPSVANRDQIESFEPGDGVVFGFTKKPLVVHFDERESFHQSETPRTNRLHRNKLESIPPTPALKPAPPKTPALSQQGTSTRTISVDTILALHATGKINDAQMLDLIERLPDGGETGARPVLEETQTTQRQVIAFRPRMVAVNGTDLEDLPMRQTEQEPAIPEDVQRGLDAYDGGADTLDKFANAMGLTSWTARPLYAKVRERRGVK